ncbi:DUF262 domain-containing protein [Stenotrophomonas rhizophila]
MNSIIDPELALEEIGSSGEGTGLEVERVDPNPLINAPFDPAKIDVFTQNRTIDLLLTRLREGEMDLSPDFQRRANLWNESRKSGLIESLLLRIPIPSLYVSEDLKGNYTVVDGLQRMCAIAQFVEVAALNKAVKSNLTPLELTGLQSLPSDFKGITYSKLPRPLQRRISETELTLHIIRASTPASVKFSIFSRINQGGLPLSSQEIRNAIYPGDWRRRTKSLAESVDFQSATDGKIRGERMEDIELALRFVAHYANMSVNERPENQNLDDFLNEFVSTHGANWSDNQWNQVEANFNRAMRYSRKVFGIYAFRKYYGETRRLPINRSLFESQAVVISMFSDSQLETLSARKAEVLAKLADEFISDGEFAASLLYATGRGASSNIRIRVLSNIFMKVLND